MISREQITMLIRSMVAGGHGRYKSKPDALVNLELGMRMLDPLNDEQLTAVFGIICGCPAGVSILSGAPGTGKSFVVKRMIGFCDLLLEVEIRIMAQLGISAAMHKGGVTINSAMGLGKSAETFFPPVHGALAKGQKSITSVYSKFKGNGWGVKKDVLTIVEEFSQAPSTTITFLYLLLKRMEAEKHGLRDLLFVGDPKQMQPINDIPAWVNPAWELPAVSKQITYPSVLNLRGEDPGVSSLDIKESLGYEPQCLYLTTVVRSENDLPLTLAMTTLGTGSIFEDESTTPLGARMCYPAGGAILGSPFGYVAKLRSDTREVITQNYGGQFHTVQSLYEKCRKNWQSVVVLMPYNKHVREWSGHMAELARTNGAKFKSYSTKINFRGKKGKVVSCNVDLSEMKLDNGKALDLASAKFVFGSTRVPPISEFYIGQPVICAKNISEHLSNGTLCTIHELLEDRIVVLVKGKAIEIGYQASQLDDEAGTIEQIPFSPGNAITIDRTQGMTFDSETTAVIVYLPPDKYLANWFATEKPAGVYQALSRVEKLEQLYILSTFKMLKDCTVACPDAIRFADELKAKSVLSGFTDYQSAKIGQFIKLEDVNLQLTSTIAVSPELASELTQLGVTDLPKGSQVLTFVSNVNTLEVVVADFTVLGIVAISQGAKALSYAHPNHGNCKAKGDYLSRVTPFVAANKPEKVVEKVAQVWRDRERVYWGVKASENVNSVPIIYCPNVVMDEKMNFTISISGCTLIPDVEVTAADGYVKWVGDDFLFLEILSWTNFLKLDYDKQNSLLTQVEVVAINNDPKRLQQSMLKPSTPPSTEKATSPAHVAMNILSVDSGVIVQQVNTQGAMGKGLAKQIAALYPVVREKYMEKHNTEGWKLGDVQFVNVSPTLVVANVAGQEKFGNDKKQTNVDALAVGLAKVAAAYPKLPVYVPYYLGSGNAGGATAVERSQTWKEVEAVINTALPSCTICYFIRNYNRQVTMDYALRMHGEVNPLPVTTTIDAMRGHGRVHTTRTFEPYSTYGFSEGDLAIATSKSGTTVVFTVGKQYQITDEMIDNERYRAQWAGAEKHSVKELDTFKGKENVWGLTMTPIGDLVNGRVVQFNI